MLESERLAREMFARSEGGRYAENTPSIHPDAVIVPAGRPDVRLTRDEMQRWSSDINRMIVTVSAHRYHPLDDERVVVEGRMRWPLEQGGFRDSEMVWALVFRDGLLYRSWPSASVDAAARELNDWPLAECEQED